MDSIDKSPTVDTAPQQSLDDAVNSVELKFKDSPALRALSIFVDKYKWDKSLTKGTGAL